MARYTLDVLTIREDGKPVATVTDRETGGLLVSALNRSDRDEALLDRVGVLISERNAA